MAGIIEIRTYRAKPGQRAELLELLSTRAFPLQQNLGMRILGPFSSIEDDVTFVWLRAFPDDASRPGLRAAFYCGEEWLGGLEAATMAMLDEYSAVAVEDAVGLWTRWPVPAPAPASLAAE